jgi:hypothetical protein
MSGDPPKKRRGRPLKAPQHLAKNNPIFQDERNARKRHLRRNHNAPNPRNILLPTTDNFIDLTVDDDGIRESLVNENSNEREVGLILIE